MAPRSEESRKKKFTIFEGLTADEASSFLDVCRDRNYVDGRRC